jgi:hypothetical protein
MANKHGNWLQRRSNGSRRDQVGHERPKVFVSSTVYDFRDLRSALKLWLEEYGYEVLMSEFNDFPQIPDRNSYESCLRSIENSDYFVLFVGGRVGGWYDHANRVSITRKEYQCAYERLKQGNLRLLVFVRKEVWDVREDRQALKKFLEDEATFDKELSSEAKAKLVNHPSKFLNDAEIIIDFIQEIGRIGEMKQACKGAGEFPSGNWIYQFASFRDVIDACRTVLDLSGNLRQKALRANLEHEIKSNLSELMEPSKEGILPITFRSKFARADFKGRYGDQSSYKGSDLILLGSFLMTAIRAVVRLKVTALGEAIISGEFLDFDKVSGTQAVGPLQKALLNLHDQIDRLRSFSSERMWEITDNLLRDSNIKNNREGKFARDNGLLALPFAVHDVIENIISLCQATYLAMEGEASFLNNEKLHPSSPLSYESEKIEEERPTFQDVENWLSNKTNG